MPQLIRSMVSQGAPITLKHRFEGICPTVYPTKKMPANATGPPMISSPNKPQPRVKQNNAAIIRQVMQIRVVEVSLLTCAQSIHCVGEVYVLLELESSKCQVGPVDVGEEDQQPQPRKQVIATLSDYSGSQHLRCRRHSWGHS